MSCLYRLFCCCIRAQHVSVTLCDGLSLLPDAYSYIGCVQCAPSFHFDGIPSTMLIITTSIQPVVSTVVGVVYRKEDARAAEYRWYKHSPLKLLGHDVHANPAEHSSSSVSYNSSSSDNDGMP